MKIETGDLIKSLTSIGTPVGRWAALGPYYAMFPVRFAYEQVLRYTEPGETVLDPFCGRGTAVYAAATTEREGLGVEINPVGYIYGAAKLSPASYKAVKKRLSEISERLKAEPEEDDVPEFFEWAYSRTVRRFLIVIRRELKWQTCTADQTLMALVLIYLHGKAGYALSNQMRQTKAMAPDYSVAWWQARGMRPPEVDPIAFMEQRIDWRYKYGRPALRRSAISFGDSRRVLRRSNFFRNARWSLLLTSPPYRGVTDYWYDQWIRLWLLGNPARPAFGAPDVGRFGHPQRYKDLLSSVFSTAAENAKRGATVYIRTDARAFTKDTTIEVLRAIWPKKSLRVIPRPVGRRTQTDLFGQASRVKSEVDLILT